MYFDNTDNAETVDEKRNKFWQTLASAFDNYADAPKELEDLVWAYEGADKITQGIINYVTTSVCEWTVPTLCRAAEGGGDPEEFTGHDFPWVHPVEVTAKRKAA